MFGRDRATAAILALGGLLMVVVRLHVWTDDFPNPDIAGIVYNAEALLRGELPYVDTVEIKPPGAFGLTAIAFALLGRSLQAWWWFHLAWLALGGFGVWWAARALHDDGAVHAPEVDRSRLHAAALATALYLVLVPMFSPNYSSWMVPAYAWALGATLQGLRSRGLGWSIVAGAAACLAVLTIQRAAVLAVAMPAAWSWARRRGLPGASARTWWAWGLGAALSCVPWLVIYGASWRALVDGVVPWQVASDYTAHAAGTWWSNAARGLWQLAQLFWVTLSLAGLGIVVARRGDADDRSGWGLLAVWLLATFVGVGLGQRYYLHYAVQYVPVVVLLGAHPAWVRGLAAVQRREDRSATGRAVAFGVVLVLGGLLVQIGLGRAQHYEAMPRRLQDGRTAAQAAGAHIHDHTGADATVQAWGWTAWRVYYWADRRCATRLYKPMGTVTTFNTNTEFADGDAVRFRDGPGAAQMIAQFDRTPPAYFVYSPSMVQAFGAPTEPLEDFVALRDRLRRDYVPEAVYGDLTLLRRRPDR